MQQLPEALLPMAEYAQFILFKLIPRAGGKTDKLPVDHRTLQVFTKDSGWQQDPSAWTTADKALQLAALAGPDHGVGFFFTPSDPFYFLDIDDCLTESRTWSDTAQSLMEQFPGAAIEISQSGTGLHIFGKYSGSAPPHSCKNTPLGLELYTDSRFVALTGSGAMGSAGVDSTAALANVVAVYFVPTTYDKDQEWTTEPVAEYTGPEDDDELIERALDTQSAASIFTGKSKFRALWEADADELSTLYPDPGSKGRPYGESEADMGLAQLLAFWTGKNCERILTIMKRSALVRDKWDREGYLELTISQAVGLQEVVYSVVKVDTTEADKSGAPKLQGTPKQIEYAAQIRAEKIAESPELLEQLITPHGPTVSARFWIEHKDETAAQIATAVAPVDSAHDPLETIDGPQFSAGYQFLGAEQQVEYFAGCVYVQDLHRVFTPSGALLKSEQFNATYGGYAFEISDSGKPTRKAWDVFTESHIVRYPKAQSTCFRPDLEPGELIQQDGQSLVNIYIPINTPRIKGDATHFLNLLAKLLPDENDRQILLAYMAACVQHKGVKFPWAPLLQGTFGNGKSLLSKCVVAAIGRRHAHLPKAGEIGEKFNEWLFGKLFIGVEEVYVPKQKMEIWNTLKTMITENWQPCRAMQQAEGMRECYANFIFNTNPKDALLKTKDDRRIAPFFTAQQSHADIVRDGMDGDYFPKLYNWLDHCDGYAIVTDFLYSYQIPDALNPAKDCHRAPITSSTAEAIQAGLGSVEQEVLEAIDESRPGFAGGWISSTALAALLKNMRRESAIPPNKRREMLQALGYDWHPALKNGRVNNPLPGIEGKPCLFIKNGHIHANLRSGAVVSESYLAAQSKQQPGAVGSAAETFRA